MNTSTLHKYTAVHVTPDLFTGKQNVTKQAHQCDAANPQAALEILYAAKYHQFQRVGENGNQITYAPINSLEPAFSIVLTEHHPLYNFTCQASVSKIKSTCLAASFEAARDTWSEGAPSKFTVCQKTHNPLEVKYINPNNPRDFLRLTRSAAPNCWV